MRAIQTVIFAALAAALFSPAPASAQNLGEAEFKQLVIGNTLHRTSSGGNSRTYYFHNEKELTYDPGTMPLYKTSWTISADGTFCRFNQYGEENCWKNFRRGKKKNEFKADNTNGRERTFTLTKGRP